MLVAVPHVVDAASGPPTDAVSFTRVDIPMPAAPESVALGDLDGVNGQDIVVALPASGGVGVMLNNGDGTFAAMVPYTGGPECVSAGVGLAVDITLGDVTGPGGPLVPDGKLDAYIACTPYVVRLTGDGAGGLLNPVPINLNLVPYLGATTQDLLVLMRRPDDNPVPLLVFQHAVGSFGRELCISYELSALEDLVCNETPVQGPLVAGDLNGTGGGVPPDEILASEGGAVMGIFGFAPPVPPNTPVTWTDSPRNVPGDPPGLESAAMGDLGNDGDLDVVVGQYVNSVNNRVDSIHYFRWDQGIGLEQIAQTLPSTPGLDAVAVADVDADGCNDIVGAGVFGRGMVHLGNAAGGFDGGQDLPQLGYQVPGTATRVGMAVGDLTADGRPEIVISDANAHAVMIFRNTSTTAGSACGSTPPTAVNDVAVVAQNTGPTAIDVLANDTDPDGGAKFVIAVTQTANSIVKIVGAGLTYQPAAGYCNDPGGVPDTFSYTLNGGSVANVAVTVQCAVAPPPPPPPAPRTCISPGTTPYTVGTPGDDVLVGSIPRDVLSGRGGNDCIFGLRGDDLLTGGTGKDLIDGSSGDDRMKGDAGDDKFRAGNGNDDITGGAGQDLINAQGGNDVISARDGERDMIDCGPGVDKVTADRSDVTKNCEYVKRPVRQA